MLAQYFGWEVESLYLMSLTLGRACAQSVSSVSKSNAMTPHCLRKAPVFSLKGFFSAPGTGVGPKQVCVIVLSVRLYVGGHGGNNKFCMMGVTLLSLKRIVATQMEANAISV